MPVSLFLAREDVMDVFTPGDHGSTFGGNALAARIGYEALCVLEEEQLAERARDLGDYFMAGLRALAHPSIADVRGRGLFIGMEFHPQWWSAARFCEALLAEGALSKDTRESVARLTPPLIITRHEIDLALDCIRRALEALERQKAERRQRRSWEAPR